MAKTIIREMEERNLFREIRKKKNAITADAAESLLEKSRRGVLAVNGDDGYPYAIPVNFLKSPLPEWGSKVPVRRGRTMRAAILLKMKSS